MEQNKKKPGTLQIWAERLRGRSRMAVATIGGVFLVGFFCASKPLSDRIDTANTRLTRAEARGMLASEVAELRHKSALYTKKLPRGIDLNDWTEYLLGGISAQRVRLIRMDPKDQLSLGPCKVLTWSIELEGDLESLSRVVEWIENGPRLMRIDRILFEGKHGRLTLAMAARGLALDVPPDKLRVEKEKEGVEKGKGARAVNTQARQRKSEPGRSGGDQTPMALPENSQLPADVTIPDEALQAGEEQK